MLQVLKNLGCYLTIAAGLYSLFAPQAITGFTGLSPVGGRGITEIRAVLGGLFIALGAVPLITRDNSNYVMLGIAYLVIAGVRVVSMFIDGSLVQSNVISLVFELFFGLILVL